MSRQKVVSDWVVDTLFRLDRLHGIVQYNVFSLCETRLSQHSARLVYGPKSLAIMSFQVVE